MQYISREQEVNLRQALHRERSILLFGARQTGKTTLINHLPHDLFLSFANPELRQQHEKDPGLLIAQVKRVSEESTKRPLVILDEIQKVPYLMDSVQYLIDQKSATFILTGSSARKLRRAPDVNLLPGRVIALYLDPLILKERKPSSLEEALIYGALPGILAVENPKDRDKELKSYVTTYLEEEVRAEALVRNLGTFGRFLEYAASESGQIINFSKLSQEIGVAQTTVMDYYQILEDCLIVHRIEPVTKSKTRKKLTRAQRYLFFDLGVRRLAAEEGALLPKETMGKLFEQFVGLELQRCAHIADGQIHIRFWRDPDGPEVDWVIQEDRCYTPIEVKWTDIPTERDIRHLQTFLSEYPEAKTGYLICRTAHRFKLAPGIFALPWQEIDSLILGSKP